MIVRERRMRPQPWRIKSASATHAWLRPFVAIEWGWEWVAFALSNWTFLEVLEYLGSFSVLVAVIFYFAESGDRVKLRHYQAWQVINTAQGKGGSGGRIEALEELNADKVPLVGVDVSTAFLQGIRLRGANLLRSSFTAADLRNSDFTGCNFTLADLESANFRGAILDQSNFADANLRNADLNGARLEGADLSGANLESADLRSANFAQVRWAGIKSVMNANIAGIQNAPAGFREWALSHGAVETAEPDR